MGAQALFLPVRRRLKKEKEKSVVYKSTWYLVRYMQAPNRLCKSEVRASVLRVKSPCEQGLPHRTYVLQAEQRLPSATEEKAKRSFPMERDPLPSTTLRVIRSARSGLGQRSFRSLLCPTPKVTPRSSLEPLVPGAAYLVYQAGSTCSRARYQQRELLLQRERGLNRNTCI